MTNSLSSRHPQYGSASPDWTLMRDAYKGERMVKTKNTTYLPYTSSQILDGAGTSVESIGSKAYLSYKMRARFPNFVREAVQMAIGMMHSQPPEIKLPKVMERIRSSKGESLPDLLRRINTEQLISGRIAVMADMPTSPAPGRDLPYLTTYNTERLINWDDGQVEELVPQVLNMVVLDESEQERKDTFNWDINEKYRVLIIGKDDENENAGIYKQGVFEEGSYITSQMRAPSWRGTTLEQLPLVIINACDLTSDVDDPALLDLANLCMTIYRADADYRQNLFMQGQDTLVTTGGGFDEDDTVRTGAGARLDLPMGADAKYIGVESSGLQEQRENIDRLEGRAGSMGAQTLDSTSRERESGDSLRIRVAARTADMNQIVETGAAGLENILRVCAVWMGENPDEVSVKPNKEFGEMPLTGQTMVEIATARSLGFPISAKSMHDLALRRRMTMMSYEEEQAAAKEEQNDDHPFAVAAKPDMAGADQNEPGDNTDDEISARNKAKKRRDA